MSIKLKCERLLFFVAVNRKLIYC